jgi:hypothetical protein
MRRGRCQLRGTVPPTFVRLTRRALEGGRRNPQRGANTFSMSTQDYTVKSGWRERSSPPLSGLCDHPHHCNATATPLRTLQRHLRRCEGARGRDIATPAIVPRAASCQWHPRVSTRPAAG